jgi:MOSC domain-containing protein YiiM
MKPMSKPMRIISLNVGEPRTVPYLAGEVSTGIFKEHAAGPLMLRRLNFDGDRQADLTVHGGKNKAVYAYPSEHYQFWRRALPEMDLPWGMFGENLTTEGLTEENAHIGDRFRIGEAVVAVSQPRLPCFKLGIRFGQPGMIKRFFASGRSGMYFSVVEEGMVGNGDEIEVVSRAPEGISIADVNRVYASPQEDIAALRRIVNANILPHGYQSDLVEALAQLGG